MKKYEKIGTLNANQLINIGIYFEMYAINEQHEDIEALKHLVKIAQEKSFLKK